MHACVHACAGVQRVRPRPALRVPPLALAPPLAHPRRAHPPPPAPRPRPARGGGAEPAAAGAAAASQGGGRGEREVRGGCAAAAAAAAAAWCVRDCRSQRPAARARRPRAPPPPQPLCAPGACRYPLPAPRSPRRLQNRRRGRPRLAHEARGAPASPHPPPGRAGGAPPRLTWSNPRCPPCWRPGRAALRPRGPPLGWRATAALALRASKAPLHGEGVGAVVPGREVAQVGQSGCQKEAGVRRALCAALGAAR